MSRRGVAQALVGALLCFAGECHVEDAVSLVQSTLHTSSALEANSSEMVDSVETGVIQVSLNASETGDIQTDGKSGTWWGQTKAKIHHWLPFASRKRVEELAMDKREMEVRLQHLEDDVTENMRDLEVERVSAERARNAEQAAVANQKDLEGKLSALQALEAREYEELSQLRDTVQQKAELELRVQQLSEAVKAKQQELEVEKTSFEQRSLLMDAEVASLKERLEKKDEANYGTVQALLESMTWKFNASEEQRPREQPPLALTMLNRARLGNRLFQWAALVSIAKEAGAKVAAPWNPKYHAESTPQLAKMGSLMWKEQEYEWLGKQPKKCHIWDRIPVKLDWNMENLSNFTLGGITKGELQLEANVPPAERGQNWARTWADAITKTKTPTKCKIVELDGYWQSAEYFVHNLDMIRQLMWNEDTAVQAQVVLDGWLEREPPVGQLVGVHLRLGDYIGASRNLNMSYYREAFEAVKTARNDTQLTCLLFSDDIVLAQKVGEEFEACNKVIPAVPCPDPWNNKYHCHGREVGDWVQFYMMSQLDNLIIADSSYSFWSAVLSPKKPLVVVPRITWPLGVASRGDYAYLNNPMYGWVNIDARLGDPDSKAVREHLHLALDRSGVPPSEWAA